MKRQRLLKPFLLLTTLTGAIFCLLNASGAHFLCVTQGCRIYAGYGLFGISFYTFGAVGFLLIFLFTLLYPRAFTGILLPITLFSALLLDTFFLGYQSLFWPCTSCLVAAFLLGLTILAGLSYFSQNSRRLVLAVGMFWLVFFLFLTLSAVQEIVFRPWPIFGPPDAPIQVFFSPDCPACRQTVRQLLDDADTAGKSAFYPIAKNQQDIRRIAHYADLTGLRNADKEIFLSLFTDIGEGSPPLNWRIRLHLLANKVNLARLGASSVPLVIAPYLPQPAPAPPEQNIFAPPSSSPLEGCSAFEDKECD